MWEFHISHRVAQAGSCSVWSSSLKAESVFTLWVFCPVLVNIVADTTRNVTYKNDASKGSKRQTMACCSISPKLLKFWGFHQANMSPMKPHLLCSPPQILAREFERNQGEARPTSVPFRPPPLKQQKTSRRSWMELDGNGWNLPHQWERLTQCLLLLRAFCKPKRMPAQLFLGKGASPR